MDIADLTRHPERLDRDTLYELRSLLALYPYYQTARLLMLQNLYLLHDPMFDEELRRAAIYITDRRVLFQLIEAGHYQFAHETGQQQEAAAAPEPGESRTISLIDNFLESIPKEEKDSETATEQKRKPTPADAAVDYVAYLLESENEAAEAATDDAPQLIGQSLIDSFIENDKGKLVLSDCPVLKPELQDNEEKDPEEGDESYFTETLARIYIKQGRYLKALEIIRRLSLQFPKKNAYFADQIRFLEKLIKNNSNK